MARSIEAMPLTMDAAAREQSRQARLVRVIQNLQRPLISVTSILAFFAIWEFAGRTCVISVITQSFRNIDCRSIPLFVSAPTKIAVAGYKMFGDGEIWNHIYVSGTEFVLGFALAIVIGIPFGMLLGWYRTFNYVFEWLVSALNAAPRVALLPLLIIWFGIGIWSKVAIVFLGAIFPLIINTQSGVRALDEMLLRAARSFGANDWQIFKTIALPGSVPFILSGLRLGVGRALVGIVVGELVAATAGVGYLIAIAGATFQTDKLFVGIFIITGAGVLLTVLLDKLEHRFDAWRPQRT